MTTTTTNTETRIVTEEVLDGSSMGDFFFWLGADGFQSLSREHFIAMVEKNKAEYVDNVSVNN